jgi:hypothetical protein
MEIHLHKPIHVHVSLQEKARTLGVLNHGISQRIIGGVEVLINYNYDFRPYFYYFLDSTIIRLPKEIIDLIDEVYTTTPTIMSVGVYHHQTATAAVFDPGCGCMEARISAKDFQSLVELYAKLFPKNIIP